MVRLPTLQCSNNADFAALDKYEETMNFILGYGARVTASEIYLTSLKDTRNPFSPVESCV